MKKLIPEILSFPYFGNPDSDAPLKVSFEDGADKLLVITGANASGKSFFIKLLAAYGREYHDLEVIRTGMASRAGADGIKKVMMYGDDETESTGDVSVNAIRGGIRTSRARTTPHLLAFDEPDLGLSEEFQGAVGKMLVEFISDKPEHNQGTIIVTHSRRICRHLLPLNPTHIRFGVDGITLEDFVNSDPPDYSIEDLERLRETGRSTYSQLQSKINEVRAASR